MRISVNLLARFSLDVGASHAQGQLRVRDGFARRGLPEIVWPVRCSRRCSNPLLRCSQAQRMRSRCTTFRSVSRVGCVRGASPRRHSCTHTCGAARGVDRADRKRCPGHRARRHARQRQEHRCVARGSDAAATQRGRSGARRWVAALPHGEGSSGIQRCHGDAEGDRSRSPGRSRIQGMRRIGVQSLASRPGTRTAGSRRKDMGVSNRIRAHRAQPATCATDNPTVDAPTGT